MMMDSDGTRFAAIAETTNFLHYFSYLPDHRQGRKGGLSARRNPAFGFAGGSGGGGDVLRHRAVWREEDRTPAAVSALCEWHALARSSGRYLRHARRAGLPALLRRLGGGADEHARRGHRGRWQDVAALVSEEGLERGDPHRLRLRGAATHRARIV